MEYVLEERIVNPHLFVGRKKELELFLKWRDDIKEKKSKSTALLARRKMGKTALMERLFNLSFQKNDVIPFYYEVEEVDKWVVDFCLDFFATFIYQYIAFKSRKPEYLNSIKISNLEKAKETARKEGLDFLIDLIENVQHLAHNEHVDRLWKAVREAPHTVAFMRKEFVFQLIDEFQFLNATIYWDKAKTNRAHNLAAGYLGTAESKIAPLLVSGSWVGWLMNELIMMLPARFRFWKLGNMPENESIEMIYKFSRYFNVPVTEETAYLIAQLSGGSPFYISCIIRSQYEDKNLTTIPGLTDTLEFETLEDQGEIKSTWMEYVSTAIKRVNDKNGKNIILYLCKHKEREVTREELLGKLQLEMTDRQLEAKLKALVNADIIQQGKSNFRYQGIKDNFFDKVFRGVYQEEIDNFQPEQIKDEYRKSFEDLQKQYRQLQGKFNYQKGYFAEYVILDQLLYYGVEKNSLLKSLTVNLPADFNFCKYENVWTYTLSVRYSRELSADILARAQSPGDYSLICEIKNRDNKKFSRSETAAFLDKFEKIKEKEGLSKSIGFVFSRKGFTKEAEKDLQQNGVAYASDTRWLEL
ncbi:MAG: hypothetical protein GY757_22210 [bacterium]|nr:hypothetical protein [bacterium]